MVTFQDKFIATCRTCAESLSLDHIEEIADLVLKSFYDSSLRSLASLVALIVQLSLSLLSSSALRTLMNCIFIYCTL